MPTAQRTKAAAAGAHERAGSYRGARSRAANRAPRALLPLCLALLLPGCGQRLLRITSEPPDAMVTLNDVQVGRTPVEVDFTYFGVYDVRLSKPGFEPLATKEEAKAPLHEWPVVDIAAAAFPGPKRTLIAWHYDLTPSSDDPSAMLSRAADLRGQLDAPAAPPLTATSPPPTEGETASAPAP